MVSTEAKNLNYLMKNIKKTQVVYQYQKGESKEAKENINTKKKKKNAQNKTQERRLYAIYVQHT